MAQLTLPELPDALHERLERQARQNRRSLIAEATALLEEALGAAEGAARQTDPVERHFGAVDLGHPVGVDNEQIDRDLAGAYAGPS